MSGGSWDYFYVKLEEVAGRLACDPSPLRAALGEMFYKSARAMHSIEWNDSGDGSDTEESDIIEALGRRAAELVADAAVSKIEGAINQAQDAIAALKGTP